MNSLIETDLAFVRCEMQKCKDRYCSISGLDKEYAGHINFVPVNFSVYMPGLSLLAERKIQKYNLQNKLFVYERIEDFISKLKDLKDAPGDQKIACIVPVIYSHLKWNSDDGVKQAFPNYPQHKMAILIEKIGEEISIALPDGQSGNGQEDIYGEYNSLRVRGKQLWDGLGEVMEAEHGFGINELVYRAIALAQLDPDRTRIFHTNIQRETVFGCAIFALSDAIHFLKKAPSFFQDIQCKDPEKCFLGDCYQIVRLPKGYMIGTQSWKRLTEYINTMPPEERTTPLTGHKKERTFEKFIEEHSDNNIKGRRINLYIQRKMIKELNKLISLLEQS